MATKKAPEETAPETTTAPAEEPFEPNMEAGDFNLEDEFKPTPLIPGGKYYGNVVKVKELKEDSTIMWEIVLADNGGVCTDGETPVDGRRLFMRNWLPKVGDEGEMTKDGAMNKRQAKINMLSKFAGDMKVNMNSMQIIRRALEGQEWLGLAVIVDVTVREFEGRFSNDIKRMVAREQ